MNTDAERPRYRVQIAETDVDRYRILADDEVDVWAAESMVGDQPIVYTLLQRVDSRVIELSQMAARRGRL
jgi:hypothetical protein